MLGRFPSTQERVGGRRGKKKKTESTKQHDNKSNESHKSSEQEVAAASHPAAVMCANSKHEPERDEPERDIFEGAQALVLLEEGGLQSWVQVVLRLPLPSFIYPCIFGAKARREWSLAKIHANIAHAYAANMRHALVLAQRPTASSNYVHAAICYRHGAQVSSTGSERVGLRACLAPRGRQRCGCLC